MSWFDDLIKNLTDTDVQVINDSKTPSGKAHVGSLRGVLIHDAVYRVLKKRGYHVEYTFGVDDYDPLDEIPYGLDDYYKDYLGQPLCNVPAPPDSKETDIANHYMEEFFNVFDELGIEVKKYYLREIYRSGEFNEAIDVILKNVEIVREIYLKVSNSVKSANWYPFQVICENCGKIGTTEVTGFDNREVIYECRPDLVTWATGCGHKGKMSPFDGNGKLPWKLEWTAKWAYRGITVEGAGKDHNSRGGSREVAVSCLSRIFKKRPPANIPYGFFKLGGAKMSSSKGIGVSAKDMADFLPSRTLRYLMLGTQPKREVNFAPTSQYITQLFNNFDKLHSNYYLGKLSDYDKLVYELSEIFHHDNYYAPNLSLLITLIQLPHIDIYKTLQNRKGESFTEVENKIVEDRIKSAKYWLENYAAPEETFQLCDHLPDNALKLSITQKAFLSKLAEYFKSCEWTENGVQTAIFDSARMTPIEPKDAFFALYTALIDKDAGPKAGNLLSCLDKNFITKRFGEIPFDEMEFWKTSGVNSNDFEEWVKTNHEKVKKIEMHSKLMSRKPSVDDSGKMQICGMGVLEFSVEKTDNKNHMKRILFCEFDGKTIHEKELNISRASAKDYIENLIKKYNLDLQIKSSIFELPLN